MLRKLIILIAIAFSAPAWADMDYHCLTSCKNSGKQTVICMDQCRYKEAPTKAATGKAEGDAHKEFVAPVPVGSRVAPAVTRSTTASMLSMDHVCVQACMQEDLQYSLCQQRCTVDRTSPARK